MHTSVYPFMIGKMKNDYWKINLWNSLTLGMIWSLIPHAEHPAPAPPLPTNPQPPPPPNKLSFICQKKLLEKGPYRGQYALAPLENHVGIYIPSIFARKCRYWIWQKRLFDRIGQWVEALYKIWNVVSQNPLGHFIEPFLPLPEALFLLPSLNSK